ncbi:MAG: mechanosensitive ion channel family protein [Nannocystis sp.]|nr:mechanosensitive ion channel family protein [Nannocystis sp.]
MNISQTMIIHNALIFGVATLAALIIAFILDRQVRRVIGFVLRSLSVADKPQLQGARAHIEKSLRRVITLATAALIILLLAGAVLATWWQLDLLRVALEWGEKAFLADVSATLYAGLKILGIAGAILLGYGLVRALIASLLRSVTAIPALEPQRVTLGLLKLRLSSLINSAAIFTALLVYSSFAGAPAYIHEPLLTITYLVLGVVGARAFALLCTVGVDIGGQLVRALGDLNSPLGYVGRFERLDQVVTLTKRTLEYLVFLGAATWISSKIQPGSFLEDVGLRLIRVLALVYIGRILVEVINLVLRELLLAGAAARSTRAQQQRHTLLPLVQSVLRYAVYFLLLVMGLSELGVETAPLIAGAGLSGLALGLGAQAFFSDIVSGFFIFVEGTFYVGDRVQVGEVIGIVEEIGVRAIKIRHESGVLHTIPNGEVRSVANHAASYVNAVVEFTVPYDQDVPKVMAAVKDHIEAFRPRYPDILGETEIVVEDLSASGALIQTLTKVKPGRDEDASEAIRAEILAALTAIGVKPQGFQTLRFDPKHPLALANGARV